MSGVSHGAALCFIAPSDLEGKRERALDAKIEEFRVIESARLPIGLERRDIKNEVGVFNSSATRRSPFDGAVLAFAIADPANVQVLLRHDHLATSGRLRTAVLAVLVPVVRVLRIERRIVVAPPAVCFCCLRGCF